VETVNSGLKNTTNRKFSFNKAKQTPNQGFMNQQGEEKGAKERGRGKGTDLFRKEKMSKSD